MKSSNYSPSRFLEVKFAFVFCALLFRASVAHATDYPTMAPLDQYLMDRSAEITLAKSAAPPCSSKTWPWLSAEVACANASSDAPAKGATAAHSTKARRIAFRISKPELSTNGPVRSQRPACAVA